MAYHNRVEEKGAVHFWRCNESVNEALLNDSSIIIATDFEGVHNTATDYTDATGRHLMNFNSLSPTNSSGLSFKNTQVKWGNTSLRMGTYTTSDRIDIQNNINDFAFGTGNYSIQFWFYMDSEEAYTRYIQSCASTSGNTWLQITTYNNGVRFTPRAGGGSYANGIPVSEWVHQHWQRQGNTLTLWENGSRVYNSTNVNYGYDIVAPNSYLRLASPNAGTRGYLDDYVVYNRAVYDSGDTTIPVPTKSISGAIETKDTIGGKNLLTSGNPSIVTGLLVGDSNKALSNTASTFASRDETNFRVEDTGGSFETWINTTLSSSGILFCSANKTVDNRFLFYIDSSGRLLIYTRSNGTLIRSLGIGKDILRDGNTHHIVITSDGSTYKIYIDGQYYPIDYISAGSNDGAWFSTQSTADNITIGAQNYNNNGATTNFVGIIDEVAIYNRPLTYDEVRNNYQAGTATNTVPNIWLG